MLCVYLHVLGAHEVVLRKNKFLCGLCKNAKFGTKISLFTVLFCLFCTVLKKCPFFMKICVSTYIVEIYMLILFQNFLTF
jgi:hypothetical protein